MKRSADDDFDSVHATLDGQRRNTWKAYGCHASKAVLNYLTKRLVAELAKDSICVTAIAPGAFATDLNESARVRAISSRA